MEAVVNEEIDLPELGEKLAQPTPARTLEILPAPPARFWNGSCRLASQFSLEDRGKIDAPERATAVSLERLEEEAGRNAPGDSRFDDLLGAEMPGDAPHCTCEPGVGVVPPSISAAAYGQILLPEQPDHVAPECIELRLRRTGPLDVQECMQLRLPFRLGLIEEGRVALLPSLGDPLPDPLPALAGTARESD